MSEFYMGGNGGFPTVEEAEWQDVSNEQPEEGIIVAMIDNDVVLTVTGEVG